MERKKLVPLVAFCLYFLKVTILPSSYAEAAILLILGAVAAFYEFKGNDQKLNDLQNKLNKMNEDLEKQTKEVEALKSFATSVKLSQSIRPTGSIGR